MEGTDPNTLVRRARDWILQDPDETTRAAMQLLIDRRDFAELASCLTPLTFGTAGLRAVEGPGPGRMNRAVVIRTTRGLADYLLASQPSDDPRPVVVGADARLHSMSYQRDVVSVFVAAGLSVRFFEAPVPTPLVAYAARVLGARAAVCITASHNPAEYAGFKLYGENAVQIVAPVDQHVASAIARVGASDQVERAGLDAVAERAQAVPASLVDEYLVAVDGLRVPSSEPRDFAIVYTPLHGVGKATALRALKLAGYQNVAVVPEQAEPDGRFPSVAFPNPEEPGALDLAMALAEERGAELLLANDPDADRLAVCVRDGNGPIRQLSGNQIGLLLADYLLRHYHDSSSPIIAASIVSSPMIEDVAKHYGARCLRTLTGFKWMLNAALAAEAESGGRLVFAFEEALGYCVGRAVRDKDGISAAVVFADLVAECRATGGVGERLAELHRRHGLWASTLASFELDPQGVQRTEATLGQLVERPPERIAGIDVSRVADFRVGSEQRAWYLGAAELVEIRLAGRARVLVRPSGTEPKIKIYADYRQPYDGDAERRPQELGARKRAGELAQALVERLQSH